MALQGVGSENEPRAHVAEIATNKMELRLDWIGLDWIGLQINKSAAQAHQVLRIGSLATFAVAAEQFLLFPL